jgi:hypothetical protein
MPYLLLFSGFLEFSLYLELQMEKEHPQGMPTVILGIGRDEMNLVELPFTPLTEQSWSSDLILERRWGSTGNDGKIRNFYKRVTGHPVYGLPAFQAEEVYVAMMEVSHRQGFENRKVHTTRYELLKIMKWGDTGQYYRRLREILEQLLAVTITTNAFWDHTLKGYREIGFHIIDEYSFFEDEKRRRKSTSGGLSLSLGSFSWSEILFESFRNGYIKTLNTEVYFGLGSYISKRLYRYEDKHLYQGEPFEVDLFKLAFEKLEMSEKYRYPSEIIRKLQPAIQEHGEKGLAKISIRKGRTPSRYKVVFTPITRPIVTLPGDDPPPIEERTTPSLMAQLTVRGMTKRTAEMLVKKYTERIEPKIEVFDWLCRLDRPLHNPAGFLRKSIEQDWSPPPGFISQPEQEERARQAEVRQQELQRQEETRRAAEALIEQARQQRREASPWKDVWERIAGDLAQRMPRQSFSIWIQPLFLAELHDDTVVIDCPSRFIKEYVEERYRSLVEEAVTTICGRQKQMIFICEDVTSR